jgi:alpha-beta hydrolase superfamily lysophospholipase
MVPRILRCRAASALFAWWMFAGMPAEPRAAEPGDGLRPRGDGGYRFRGLRPAEAESLGVLSPGGVMVTSVAPGSAADVAGLSRGDILRSYGLSLIGDAASMQSAARRYRAGDTVQVGLLRDGAVIQLDLVPRARPLLSPPGVDVEVTFFPAADGTRLRAVLAGPEGRAGARLPALVVAAGQATPPPTAGWTSDPASLRGGAAGLGLTFGVGPGAEGIGGAIGPAGARSGQLAQEDPLPSTSAALERRLAEEVAEAAARAGIRVLRFDPRGAGESEGLDSPQVDFTTEVDDLRQAIHFLRRRADVDPAAVFLWGHGEAATEAALLAASEDLAGLAVSSACGRSVLEYRAAIARRRGELNGRSPGEIERQVSDEVALLAAIVAGATPEELRSRPDLGRLVNPAGRVLDDRTVGYWRERLMVNVGEVYAAVNEPTLVIHTAADPYSFQVDHEEIGRILAASGNRSVEIAQLAPAALPGVLVRWMRALLPGT